MFAGILAVVAFPFLLALFSIIFERFASLRNRFASEKTVARILCDYIGETHRSVFGKKRHASESKDLFIPALIIALELFIILIVIFI